MAAQISVEHFDVEAPADLRFLAQINITGWSDAVLDAEQPEVLEILLDDHDVDQLIAKLQALRGGQGG